MSAITTLNPKAEVARAAAALQLNIGAARGLQDVLKTNLGPKGTIKMYVECLGSFSESNRVFLLPLSRPTNLTLSSSCLGFLNGICFTIHVC